ncbi:hypothetical protein K501DRAFT_251708 [Backusella circina FSU 941]|nr:hypothetical protein K501DRAFT_251708 [Backusella circina FSU 941]
MLSSEESIQYPEKRFSPDLREKLTIQTDAATRFSVNSNLMNYSIPKNNDSVTKTTSVLANSNNNIVPSSSFSVDKREIQKGDSDTRTRQLEAQIEQLTLQNVKLQRTNRLLKVDTDNLIEQKTRPLEQTIRDLTMANVRLQRASRLLQMEVEEKKSELNTYKQNQILKMKSVGPEYEFLVQMVNLLQRQITGKPTCEDTCCFTMQPIDQSTMVMTLPSTEYEEEDEEDEVEAQHICRPIIHSTISQGSYAMELENKIIRLEQFIDELEQEKEQMTRQNGYKDNDVDTLKKELKIKDDIVSQLEQDFMGLEDQIEHLQKELQDQTMFSNDNNRKPVNRHLSVPVQRDPKRQSQLLMESKRRSLAIKDTDLLEQMLRGDLAGFEDSDDNSVDNDDEEEEQVLDLGDNGDDDDNDSAITSNDMDEEKEEKESVTSRTVSPINDNSESLKGNLDESSCLTCNAFPCNFPCKHSPPKPSNHSENDPFALFTGVTLILGFASQMGVTDDWTVPVTLATLVSGFLWSGNNNKKAKRFTHQQKITAVTVEE